MTAVSVAEIPFRRVLGLNQQTYQRLKLALGLQLRHQVFVGVCDDLQLRDRLAAQLQTDLVASETPLRLVTLRLNITDPNPIAQVRRWLNEPSFRNTTPTFQIIGIEQLTRQPAAVQRQFLTYLQTFDRGFSYLDCNLLLWMPQPWFRSIPQSAPTFWQLHTGIFEFVGDPTPLGATIEPIRRVEDWTEASAPPAESDQPEALLVSAKEVALADERLSERVAVLAPKSIAIELQAEAEPSALPLIEQIERLHQQQAPAANLAEAYRALAYLYRERVDRGDIAEMTVKLAIQAYEQVLVWLPEASPQWADLLNELGNLHWTQSRQIEPQQQLQRAIEVYELALLKTDQSPTLAMLYNNLGAAYADLARYDQPAVALQKAIAAYQQALEYRQPKADPLRFASTQNNLGTAFWNLAQHQHPLENLQQAIVAYSEALHFYRPAQEPLNYAMIQNNLGTAYWNIAQYERPQDWLRLAIVSYGHALRYRTQENVPAAFAATQSNLGTACWHMANCVEEAEARRDYLQQAVTAYQAAIETAESLQEPLSFDVFATHNNLGLAYHQLAIDPQIATFDRLAQLDLALHHHLQAVQGWQHSELRQTAIESVLQTMRSIYEQGGIAGQNQALAQIPATLLAELLPKL